MPTITYRTDKATKQRLAEFAKEQNISINKAIDLMVCEAIAEKDAFNTFQRRASQGNPQHALDFLNAKAIDK